MKEPILNYLGHFTFYISRPLEREETLMNDSVYEGQALQGLCMLAPCDLKVRDRICFRDDGEIRVYRGSRLIHTTWLIR